MREGTKCKTYLFNLPHQASNGLDNIKPIKNINVNRPRKWHERNKKDTLQRLHPSTYLYQRFN